MFVKTRVLPEKKPYLFVCFNPSLRQQEQQHTWTHTQRLTDVKGAEVEKIAELSTDINPGGLFGISLESLSSYVV